MIIFFIFIFSSFIYPLQIEVQSDGFPFPFLLTEEMDYKVQGLKISEEKWIINIWQDLMFSPLGVDYQKVLKETKSVKNFIRYDPFMSNENFNEIIKIKKGNCVSYVSYLKKKLKSLGFVVEEVHGIVFSSKKNNPFYLSNLSATPHRWIKVFFPDLGWVSFDPVSESGRITKYHLPLKDGSHLKLLKNLKIVVQRWD